MVRVYCQGRRSQAGSAVMKLLQACPDALVPLCVPCGGTEDHLHDLPTWI